MIEGLLEIKYSIELSEIDDKIKSNIINKINVFLLTHCKHVIVCDYIDITPDYGHNIYYCSVCKSTID